MHYVPTALPIPPKQKEPSIIASTPPKQSKLLKIKGLNQNQWIIIPEPLNIKQHNTDELISIIIEWALKMKKLMKQIEEKVPDAVI
jgi:hypothetical protein